MTEKAEEREKQKNIEKQSQNNLSGVIKDKVQG